jgi:hypothetical protein
VPNDAQEDVGLYSLRKNSVETSFVTRARLQPGRQPLIKKGWALQAAEKFNLGEGYGL